MPDYTADAWRQFGKVVRTERKKAGFRDTTAWAAEVGRSTRMLLGLERGEPVGDETIERVAEALGWELSWAYQLLETGSKPTVTERNPRPEGEIDRRSVGELTEAGEAPLLSIDPEALRGLSDEQQAIVIREAQEHALRTARLLRGER